MLITAPTRNADEVDLGVSTVTLKLHESDGGGGRGGETRGSSWYSGPYLFNFTSENFYYQLVLPRMLYYCPVRVRHSTFYYDCRPILRISGFRTYRFHSMQDPDPHLEGWPVPPECDQTCPLVMSEGVLRYREAARKNPACELWNTFPVFCKTRSRSSSFTKNKVHFIALRQSFWDAGRCMQPPHTSEQLCTWTEDNFGGPLWTHPLIPLFTDFSIQWDLGNRGGGTEPLWMPKSDFSALVPGK